MKKILISLLIIAFAVSMSIMGIACKEEAADETSDASSAAEETVDKATDEATEEVVVTAENGDSCMDCHNDTTLVLAREVQWGASLHGSGMTFERNGASCANCHTSEGFTERIRCSDYRAHGRCI